MYCHALLSEGEEVAVRVKRVTDTREGLKQNNNYSMPIFEVGTNVVAEDNVRKNIILMFEVGTNVVARGYVRSTPLFHIRNTRYPDSLHSVRPQIRSFLGEVSSTIFENSCNTRYSEAHSQSAEWLQKTRRSARLFCNYVGTFNANEKIYSRKNPAYYCNTSKLKGIHMNNLTETVFSRFTSHFLLPKAAFTLAEVLITLGIIGVVAALTLPTIISNYKKQVTVSKLQKTYSTINNAFKQSEAANESSEFWDDPVVTGSQSYFEKYFKPYLNGATQCFSYQECGYKSNPPYKFLNGAYIQTSMDSNSLKRDRFAFYMPDGVFYWFIIAGGAGVIIPQSIVYIDINGGKSPNIIGKDVFLFHRVPGKGILPSGYQQPANTVSNVCQRDGQYCAAKIMQDGWKITYPY